MRFTRGNPAHCPIYVLNSALSYLSQYDPKTIQHHVQTLTTDLLQRLEHLQIPVSTPADPARHGASVCIPSPRAAQIVTSMHEQGIYAWNGQGRIRVSFHGYNSSHDVDRTVAALRHAIQSSC